MLCNSHNCILCKLARNWKTVQVGTILKEAQTQLIECLACPANSGYIRQMKVAKNAEKYNVLPWQCKEGNNAFGIFQFPKTFHSTGRQ